MSQSQMLARNSPVPLYHQLLELFHQYLEDGTWAPGETIPSESELAHQFDVSDITVRQALLSIAREGRLIRRRGVGTVVVELPSVTAQVEAVGCLATTWRFDALEVQVLESGQSNRAAGPPHGLGALEAFYVRRLCLSEGEPLFLQTMFLPSSLGDKVPMQDWSSTDIWRILRKVMPEPTGMREMIEAITLAKYEADVLKARERTLALLVERTVYNEQGAAFFERVIFKHAKLILEMRQSFSLYNEEQL